MSEIDINGIITILAVIIYVIVFFIQKAQIEKQKGIVASMESFMKIFNVDEVVKYNNMREETYKMNMENILRNNEDILKIVKESSKKIENNFKNEYDIKIQEKYEEVFLFAVKSIEFSNEEQKKILYGSLRKNKENIEKFIYDSNKSNL